MLGVCGGVGIKKLADPVQEAPLALQPSLGRDCLKRSQWWPRLPEPGKQCGSGLWVEARRRPR